MRAELVKVDGANSLAAYGADDGLWPRTRSDDFCGEHKSVIAAMQEPTQTMIDRATDCCFERAGADGYISVYLTDEEAAEVWRAMKTASLNG